MDIFVLLGASGWSIGCDTADDDGWVRPVARGRAHPRPAERFAMLLVTGARGGPPSSLLVLRLQRPEQPDLPFLTRLFYRGGRLRSVCWSVRNCVPWRRLRLGGRWRDLGTGPAGRGRLL